MIQRIQSVYMLLVFSLMAVLVFIPISTSFSRIVPVYTALAGAVAFAAIFNIFRSKKRKMQIRMCYALIALLVLMYALYFIFEKDYLPLSEFYRQVRFTFVFPMIAIILLFLAIGGMRKDEKLVRSLDRLR
jgi:cation transport ATPase